jgi:hypothetical protein
VSFRYRGGEWRPAARPQGKRPNSRRLFRPALSVRLPAATDPFSLTPSTLHALAMRRVVYTRGQQCDRLAVRTARGHGGPRLQGARHQSAIDNRQSAIQNPPPPGGTP